MKMIIGIINLSLMAKYFGVSFGKDLWILSLTLALFIDSIIWGPINETFRAKSIFLRGEYGEIEAVDMTKSLIFYTVLISLAVVGLVLLYPNVLAKIVAPTYEGAQLNDLVRMVRFIAPALLINQLTLLGIGILNAHESFFIPEISGFISAIINLSLIIYLAPFLGVYSLVVAYYLGVILLLCMIIFQIHKLKIGVLKGYKNLHFNDFMVFFMFSMPFFFPYFFGQISTVLEKTLASTIGIGTVSILDYSRKFTDIFTTTLTSVLITILVPTLSKSFIEKNPKDFVFNFMQLYQLGLLVLTFVIAFFTVCSQSVVDLFYGKGLISNEILIDIGKLTKYYSWSTLSVFIYTIFGLVLLTSGSRKKYAFFGIVSQSISILLNVLFFKKIGVGIFPISFFLSHLFTGALMFCHFPYKSKLLYLNVGKYLFFLLVTSILIYSINKLPFHFANSFTNIFFNTFFILLIMLVMIFLLKLDEKRQIKYLVQKIFNNA
jgi:peptidoglycan biosynthesis protein MviN/MurJ (putative lipid II flippase)